MQLSTLWPAFVVYILMIPSEWGEMECHYRFNVQSLMAKIVRLFFPRVDWVFALQALRTLAIF